MRVGVNLAQEARQRFGIDHEANNSISVYRSLLTES
jgi:hypothetical protein